MTHYKITIKEVGHKKPITTEFIGNKSYREIIEFYGLNNPDVEDYCIEIIKPKDDDKARID